MRNDRRSNMEEEYKAEKGAQKRIIEKYSKSQEGEEEEQEEEWVEPEDTEEEEW